MGLCREKTEEENTLKRRSVQNVYPIDRCVQHRNHIQSCMYEEGNPDNRHYTWRNLMCNCILSATTEKISF